jgi:hypothetical protein
MTTFETRPGGREGAARSKPGATAKSRKEAIEAAARAEGATVEQRADGSVVIDKKAKKARPK